jgi:hypothetical protein
MFRFLSPTPFIAPVAELSAVRPESVSKFTLIQGHVWPWFMMVYGVLIR